MIHTDAPFGTIENAYEYLGLLAQTVDEALNEVGDQLLACTDRQQQRQADAWQVVLYTTTKLAEHVATSRRLVNDLRTLRNLLQRTDGCTSAGAAQVAYDAST